MLTIATKTPVPCKYCGKLPSIWVIDKHIIRFKEDRENGGLRDYVDTKQHVVHYKIRCPGKMNPKKSEVCFKSPTFIRKKIDLAIDMWNNANTVPEVTTSDVEEG